MALIFCGSIAHCTRCLNLIFFGKHKTKLQDKNKVSSLESQHSMQKLKVIFEQEQIMEGILLQ